MLLLFVAAPLRRSGAYTHSRTSPRCGSIRGPSAGSPAWWWSWWAGSTSSRSCMALPWRSGSPPGLPAWVGAVAVVAVVCLTVVAGGMRSHHLCPGVPVLAEADGAGGAARVHAAGAGAATALPPLAARPSNPAARRRPGCTRTSPCSWPCCFGTLGLPHVLVRFYTNPDGQSARRTTADCAGPAVGVLPVSDGVRPARPDVRPRPAAERAGRCPGAAAARAGWSAGRPATCCPPWSWQGPSPRSCPRRRGWWSRWPGVISQDVFGGSVRGFRLAAADLGTVPLGLALHDGLAGAGRQRGRWCSRSPRPRICPVLLLGIWWRGPDRRRRHRRHGDRRRCCAAGRWWPAPVLGLPARTAALAGAARRLDGAGRVRRDGPGVPGHQGTACRGRHDRVMTRLHTPERPLATER